MAKTSCPPLDPESLPEMVDDPDAQLSNGCVLRDALGQAEWASKCSSKKSNSGLLDLLARRPQKPSFYELLRPWPHISPPGNPVPSLRWQGRVTQVIGRTGGIRRAVLFGGRVCQIARLGRAGVSGRDCRISRHHGAIPCHWRSQAAFATAIRCMHLGARPTLRVERRACWAG